jgi:hypothetical protein
MDGLILLRRARDAGLRVEAAGDKLLIRGPKRAEQVVKLLAEHKPEVLAALARPRSDLIEPLRWRERFTTRSFEWFRDQRSWEEARQLAWGDLQNEWHERHGKRWSAWQCAGCDQPIGGLEALDLPDGNRVHREPIVCLITFGNRWRSEADDGLVALGLQASEGTPSSAMNCVTSTIAPVLAPAQILRKDDP